MRAPHLVIPAQAGIQPREGCGTHWIPAFAGMTKRRGNGEGACERLHTLSSLRAKCRNPAGFISDEWVVSVVRRTHDPLMLSALLIYIAQSATALAQGQPAPVVISPHDTALLAPLSAPPSDETIQDIEKASRSRPWRFEPDGRLRTPSIELREVSCARNGARHFACRYQLRERGFAETSFGPWTDRAKVFTQLGTDWVMLNAEARCAEMAPDELPDYCLPAK